jgi:hypothetical protein
MIDAMPNETDIQRRDRAVIAFAILSGARDRAIISFRLKHIDIEHDLVEHDARDVRTKRAKTFPTWFFPVGNDIRRMVVDWVTYLRGEKGFRPDDPLFPKTMVAQGEDLAFRVVSLDRAPWANANPVRISSAKPARGQGCLTSILTPCGKPSFRSRMSGSLTWKL